MIIPSKIYFTLGLAIVMLTSCSTMQSARDTAGVLALYTTQVKTDSEKFAANRLELDKARIANIDSMEQLAVQMENDNALRVQVWQLSNNEDRAKLFQGLAEAADLVATQSDEFAALRTKQEAADTSMQSAITVQSKQLDDTAKGLAVLAETPSWQDEAKFYFQYLSAVRTDIASLSTNTMQQVKSGTNNVAKKVSTANN
jgi:hypothetical protein